jgi:tetratricopeptide (TPR) repeat protein
MIRVLETTNGMWKPGYNNNQAVDMTKEVSMVFFIDDQSSKTSDELFTSWATTSYKKGSTALYEKHNVDKALRCFNDGINYLPNDKCLLLLRGICRFEKGDSEGAMEDWNRMNEQGGNIDMSEYADLLKDMKGYDQLMATLKK